MNRFRLMTTSTLLAGLLVAGAASAQGPRAGGPGGPGGARGPGGPGRGGPMLALRGLDLTEPQQQQVRDIREQERAGMRQLEERMRKASEALRDAVETVPVNEGLIRQSSDALADIQAEASIREAHVYNQIWAVLTPAQQAQAKKLRAERESRQVERQQNVEQRRQGRRN